MLGPGNEQFIVNGGNLFGPITPIIIISALMQKSCTLALRCRIHVTHQSRGEQSTKQPSAESFSLVKLSPITKENCAAKKHINWPKFM